MGNKGMPYCHKNSLFAACHLLLALFLSSCVPPSAVQKDNSDSSRKPILPDSQVVFQDYESLHFKIRAHSYGKAQELSMLCEEIYKKIMFDTNLLSFKPKENYQITIYSNRDEYRRETGYPAWSGGGTLTTPLEKLPPSQKGITARTSISTFEEICSPPLLAHEISHLVFNEFMEFQTYEQSAKLLWLNEGLAEFEEIEFYEENQKKNLLEILNPIIKKNAIPLDQILSFRPANERNEITGNFFYGGQNIAYTRIDLWYWQVRALTDFLIKKDGAYHFYLLLNAFKQGKNPADAFNIAYPGKWSNLRDLENEWKESFFE